MPGWLTPALAVYGAVLSSFVAGWNVWRALRDRGRLRVRVSLGEVVTLDERGAKLPGGVPVILVSVVNLGRDTVQVAAIGGEVERKRGEPARDFVIWNDARVDPVFALPAFPWRMGAGDSVSFRLPPQACRPEYRCFGVTDTTGRMWRASRRQMKALQRALKAGAGA